MKRCIANKLLGSKLSFTPIQACRFSTSANKNNALNSLWNRETSYYYLKKSFSTNTNISDADKQEIQELLKTGKPDSMIIGFTCNKCSNRQFNQMSKIAYEKGVVIINCKSCKVKHLISDHLGWFDSQNTAGTIEEIMERKGLKVDKLEYLPDELVK